MKVNIKLDHKVAQWLVSLIQLARSNYMANHFKSLDYVHTEIGAKAHQAFTKAYLELCDESEKAIKQSFTDKEATNGEK
jgi:hypothetical protein